MLNIRQMVLFVICLYSAGEGFTHSSDILVSEVQSLLEKTEEIKLSNRPQFLKNMSILDNKSHTFSSNQSCYFQYLKSYQLSYDGQFDVAKNKVQDLLTQCKDSVVFVKLNALLASISAISGDYHQAIESLDEIIPLIDKTKDPKIKLNIYPAASMVYRLINQFELSLKFSELLINEHPPNSLLCKVKVNKTLSAFKLPNHNVSDSEVNDIIKFCKKNKQLVYAQLQLVYWLTKKMEDADSAIVYQQLLARLKADEPLIEQTKFTNIIGLKNSLMAQLYEKIGQFELAKQYAQLALDGSITIGETVQKIKALEVLISYYQMQGDYEKVSQYLIEKNKSEKNYYSNKQAKFMAFQTVKHNNLANEYQIKALSQENKLLELQNQLAEKSKKNQQLLNVLFGIIVIFFVLFAYRLIKQQRKFKRMSEYDYMTMIYNRKGIKDYMEYLLPNAQKNNELVAYIIFDLDLFKRINDVHGHVVGDWVIKNTIKACKDLNNEKAIFARLGGEEFSAVMRDSSVDKAIAFADACREAICAIQTEEETGSVFQISASFGITTSELSGYDYNNMMNHADNALYYSKENGRNKITLYYPYHQKQ